jgi:asparagine synthetase B (glutamine-hydrolysing)
MCGIVGVVDHNKQIDKDLISNMTEVLSHRGPDDQGI